ncbi:VOC family protein [Aggregatilineales bacterium SYSU G02658]
MTHPIGGVYELCIGTQDPMRDLLYWQRFGYHLDKIGTLSADDARALYGVPSALKSYRLGHQDADHGLIRLMLWDAPTNDGLQLTSMRALGNRWGATLTHDLYNIINHAEDARAQGLPITFSPPIRQQIYRAPSGQPFIDDAPCVREVIMIQPHARQVLFQRFGYVIPHYGAVNPHSAFKTSQITHCGLVVQGGDDLIDFYEHTLGLLRARDNLITEYQEVKDGANVFQLTEGEQYVCTDFDDPRSSTNPMLAHSGRLKIIRYKHSAPLPDHHAQSRPGVLGCSLYTYRVSDLTAYHQRVTQSAAHSVTPILTDEFGQQAFSFIAPDGYFWTLMSR